MHALVGGKIAQLGRRLIDGAAKSMAEDFFRRFDEEMQRQHPQAAAASGERKIPVWVWVAGAVVAVAVAAFWMMR